MGDFARRAVRALAFGGRVYIWMIAGLFAVVFAVALAGAMLSELGGPMLVGTIIVAAVATRDVPRGQRVVEAFEILLIVVLVVGAYKACNPHQTLP